MRSPRGAYTIDAANAQEHAVQVMQILSLDNKLDGRLP